MSGEIKQMTAKDPILSKFLMRSRAISKVKKVYLFGSRARGDERPDSDYDLLLVVSTDFSLADKDKLYDAVLDLLFETGRLISLKIYKEDLFQRLVNMKTVFMQNVMKEGIQIG